VPSTPDPTAMADVVDVVDDPPAISDVVVDEGMVRPETRPPPQAVIARPTANAPGSIQRLNTSSFLAEHDTLTF